MQGVDIEKAERWGEEQMVKSLVRVREIKRD
jgi:hypothetical protein